MSALDQLKVDPVMEKPWQRAKRMQRYDFWNKSQYPPFEIEPMKNERTRLSKEMTPEERAARKQWVKDQAIRYPKREVPGVKPFNIFRRIYRTPMNLVEGALSNVTSPFTANVVRRVAGKAGLGLAVTWFLVYQLKYNQNSWTHSGGWVVSQVKPTTFIGQDGAQVVEKHASDFYDRGFKSRNVLLYK